MTLVMDGVRRSPAVAPVVASAMAVPIPAVMPVVKPRPKKVHKSTARANAGVRFVTGMDGIRRAVPLTPREMLANIQAPAVTPVDGLGAIGAVVEEMGSESVLAVPRRQVAWQRPVIAFGLVAAALAVSVMSMQSMVTPKTNASVSAAAVAPSPKPSAPVAAPVPNNAGLQKILDEFAAANGSQWGIVVKDLKTGEVASHNQDAQFTSASLYKLFVAQRIYQRLDIGQLTYGQPAGGGTGRNIEQCLRVMINVSDNACGRALGTILGWGRQNQALELEGYKQTDLASPQKTSAADVARMYTRLYNGTLLSSNSSNRFMDLLKDQRVSNRLPQGLPAGTKIAHKTGDLWGYTHDAGIVFGPKTDYLVVVTSGPWKAPSAAAGQFADLSAKLWNYFEQ